jgi:hypothetical protein
MHRAFLLASIILLAGCQAHNPTPPARQLSPDEQRARAMCQDMLTSDAAYGGGPDYWIDNCMKLRLREIKAGLR